MLVKQTIYYLETKTFLKLLILKTKFLGIIVDEDLEWKEYINLQKTQTYTVL